MTTMTPIAWERANRIVRSIPSVSMLVLAVATVWAPGPASAEEPIVVYTAKKIITMDPTNPTATAVAVRGRDIVSVGSLESLKPWLDAHAHRIDERFEKKTLMPGLIDPHLHPLLGALQFGTEWITPEAWTLHDASVPATRSQKEYRERLAAALERTRGDGKPIFITWGWSEPSHGPMTRPILDELEPEKPVMVWQRSVHEAVFNSAALAYMGLDEDATRGHSETEIDWEAGHFLEAGLFEVAMPRLAPYLMSPAFVDPGFQRNRAYLTANGVTTVGDLSTGAFDWELEIQALTRNYVDRPAPFRTVLVPAAQAPSLADRGIDGTYEFLDAELSRQNAPPQLVYGKRIKLFADGAMFSQLMQLEAPGYIDGHEGEWITPPDVFDAQARKYWTEGYRIHVHANGDKGIGFTLGVFEKLQRAHPRLRNSLVLEHYGYATEALNQRVADLGASVSANPYYVTALGDTYAEVGLGVDRARRITPLAGLVDRGVTVTLHSDFGMAPASPLFLAWTAITRETESGKVFQPPRGLTREEALQAITVDAAYVLGLDHEIGSIEAGKRADFAVLESDPTRGRVDKLRKIGVWGVVFEGEVHEAKKAD